MPNRNHSMNDDDDADDGDDAISFALFGHWYGAIAIWTYFSFFFVCSLEFGMHATRISKYGI